MTLSLGQFSNLLSNWQFDLTLDAARQYEARQVYATNDTFVFKRIVTEDIAIMTQDADPTGDVFVVRIKTLPPEHLLPRCATRYGVIWYKADWETSTERKLECKLVMSSEHADLRRRYDDIDRRNRMARRVADLLKWTPAVAMEIFRVMDEAQLLSFVSTIEQHNKVTIYEPPQDPARDPAENQSGPQPDQANPQAEGQAPDQGGRPAPGPGQQD